MAIQRKDSSTMSHRIFTVTAIVAGIACICSAHAQVTQSCSQISIASNSPAGANGVTAPAGGASGTLSALPSSAQPVVSATLGRKDRRYHFSSTGPAYDALRSTNRVQSLDARFTEGGIELRSADNVLRSGSVDSDTAIGSSQSSPRLRTAMRTGWNITGVR